jgi:hypothetical protein
VPRAVIPSWSPKDLRRPGALVAAIGGLVVTAPLATVAACNVHEVGHGTVATILGWQVERIELCLPAGGGVVYSHVGTWAGNAQGYAGGLLAAAFLIGVYVLLVARRRRPLDGPVWWFGGLGSILPVGPQIVNGVLEGAVRPGQDYTEVYASVMAPLVLMALVGAVVAYSWRWRAPWTAGDGPSQPA